jgi:hypothetical protein
MTQLIVVLFGTAARDLVFVLTSNGSLAWKHQDSWRTALGDNNFRIGLHLDLPLAFTSDCTGNRSHNHQHTGTFGSPETVR